MVPQIGREKQGYHDFLGPTRPYIFKIHSTFVSVAIRPSGRAVHRLDDRSPTSVRRRCTHTHTKQIKRASIRITAIFFFIFSVLWKSGRMAPQNKTCQACCICFLELDSQTPLEGSLKKALVPIYCVQHPCAKCKKSNAHL